MLPCSIAVAVHVHIRRSIASSARRVDPLAHPCASFPTARSTPEHPSRRGGFAWPTVIKREHQARSLQPKITKPTIPTAPTDTPRTMIRHQRNIVLTTVHTTARRRSPATHTASSSFPCPQPTRHTGTPPRNKFIAAHHVLRQLLYCLASHCTMHIPSYPLPPVCCRAHTHTYTTVLRQLRKVSPTKATSIASTTTTTCHAHIYASQHCRRNNRRAWLT